MSRWITIGITIFLSGCFHSKPVNTPLLMHFEADIPTIGLIADSQLQTENVHSNTSILNNKFSELLVEVAIRTTAQNELAETGLNALLNELASSEADIIFYLGDGLNNGCEDEADRFFELLKKHQSEVPIFMVLGNHDYLAAGNARKSNVRRKLCGDNNEPLSKLEVAERIERLNQASFALHQNSSLRGWSYITSLEARDTSCSSSTEQDSEANCFHAGVLKSPSVTFLLLDTSHYENVGTYGEFSGAKGYVGSTQIDWIQKRLINNNSPRVLLSHYSATAFSGYSSTAMDTLHLPTSINRVGELFNDNLENGNLWIWGHSHSATGILTLRKITGLDSPLSIETYEVGSTTDYGNAGALLHLSDGEVSADTQPLCQLFNTSACSSLPENLQTNHVPNVLPGGTLEDSVGLTKAYRMDGWGLETDRIVRSNIHDLTNNHYKFYNFNSPEEMQLCMLRLASANEAIGTYALGGLEGDECVQETRNP